MSSMSPARNRYARNRCDRSGSPGPAGLLRSFVFVLVIAAGFGGTLIAQPDTVPAQPDPLAAQPTGQVHLTILHYNDFHAQNIPTTLFEKNADGKRVPREVGGYAVLKAYIDSLRAVSPNPILLHGGDDLQGTPVSTITEGRSQFELLELIQPDAMVLGNHEFDYGAENILLLLPTVTFPIISANLWDKSTGAPFVPRYRLIEREGLRIGIIGLSPVELKDLTMRQNVENIEMLDAVTVTKDLISTMERDFNTGFIVLLSHMGIEHDLLIADKVEGIDVIVGGHSHTTLHEPRIVNDVVIVQAGSKGRWLGKLDLVVDAGSGVVVSSSGSLIVTATENMRPDPVVAAKVRQLEGLVDEGLNQVIGRLETDWIRSSGHESNVGNWQTDVMRDYAAADVAFQNSGGIRKDMPAGPITLRDMWEMNPFGNEFVTFEVKGSLLREMIVYQASLGDREFCQVSGLRYKYDRAAKTLNVDVGGEALDPERRYKIVTNSFVAGHLRGTFGLPEADIEIEPVHPVQTDREVFIEYIGRQKTISSRVEGRITIIGK